MINADATIATVTQLNALTGGLFLLACFGMVATRQILACLKIFIGQSIFLAASACFLALRRLRTELRRVRARSLTWSIFFQKPTK